jgi:uncharacterized protein (TIGR02594 family)
MKLVELPWIAAGRRDIGQREIHGPKHNPFIVDLWQKLKLPYRDDETPYCTGWVSVKYMQAGIPYLNTAYSLNYLKYGVELDKPCYGCLAVKKRYNSRGKLIGGHVTFPIGRTLNGRLLCLGANQDDKVGVNEYDPKVFETFRMPIGDWPRQALPIYRSHPKTMREA